MTDRDPVPEDSTADSADLESNYLEEMAEHLQTAAREFDSLTDRQWAAVAEAVHLQVTAVVKYGTLGQLQDRLDWALDVVDESLGNRGFALISLISAPNFVRAISPIQADLQPTTVDWLYYLNAAYGDWISDLIIAHGTSHMDWQRLAARPITVDEGNVPSKLVSIQIAREDGEVLQLETTPGSFFRLINLLVQRAVDLPADHIRQVDSIVWKRLAESVNTLNQLLLSNRATSLPESAKGE